MVSRIWGFLIKALGYLLLAILVAILLFAFVWYPYKVSRYEPTPPVHLPQKEAYLEQINRQKVDKRPNIVFIMFDDLGYGDLSCYGNKLIQTPAIDSIAEKGIKFTNFYSCSPVCTPARAGLLTGRLPIRTRAGHVFFQTGTTIANISKFMGKANELPKDEILIPEILKAAGYRTGIIGKWHLGDIEGHLPNDFGFDHFYGLRYSVDQLPLHIYRNNEIEEEDHTEMADGSTIYTDADAELKTKGIDLTQLTDKLTNEAINFINTDKTKPFFLYFAHSFPHTPHFASKERSGSSPAGLYGDVVADLDNSVAQVMASLEKNGLLENTLVVITSDNGAAYNGSSGYLRGRKGDTYEGGQRVPLIVYWKHEFSKGTVTDHMAMNIDFMPTFLSMIGLPLPNDRVIDGKDMTPILKENSASRKNLFYLSAYDGSITGTRNDRYKYHENGFTAYPMFKALGFIKKAKPQLNDLLMDNESHNLIKKYPKEAETLKNNMDQKIESLQSETNPRGWIEN